MWEDDKPEKKSTSNVSNSETKSYSGNTSSLTYEERLEQARKARIGSANESFNSETIQTRAAIFRDQYKLPGELVELVLTKDFSYKGNVFKKGTLIYADMTINKSRVLFNITNIAHHQMVLEVRDIRDGRLGMYSSKAAELWDSYESETLNENTETVSQEISSTTGSRVISNSVKALASFFKKKRLRNDDKILLLNDQELIIQIVISRALITEMKKEKNL